MMPNLLQYPIAMFGALRAGLVVVNTNPLYTARELEHQLQDSGATAIVILENFAHVLQEVIAHTERAQGARHGGGRPARLRRNPWIVNFVVRHVRKQVPAVAHRRRHRLSRTRCAAGERCSSTPVTLGHDDIAFLQYTGGTTGVSKGAMLTHGNIVANVLQARAWIGPRVSRRSRRRSSRRCRCITSSR